MKYLLLFTLIFASDVVEIKGLNEKNFNVAKRSGITLVEFWANWNVANKVTLLDSITIEDAKIYRVLIDTNMILATEQKIVVVPTLLFFDDGVEQKRLQADLTFKMKVTKKEIQKLNRERVKLADQHRGIKDMRRVPNVVIIVDGLNLSAISSEVKAKPSSNKSFTKGATKTPVIAPTAKVIVAGLSIKLLR